jgi:uncharacterized delta-60 repeat protein
MGQQQGIVRAGALDPTFNKTGILKFPIPAISGFIPSAVLPQPEEKLLVALPLAGNSAGYAVARLKADGALDEQFGVDKHGFVFVPLDTVEELYIFGISATANGGWLIVGQGMTGPTGYLLVIRHLPDGQLDKSLNGTGILFIPYGDFGKSGHKAVAVSPGNRAATDDAQQTSALISVAEQADGKIVLVSNIAHGIGQQKGIVLRRNSDGSRDTSFNGEGFAIIELEGVSHQWNSASSVAVQADGRILVGGSLFNGLQDRGVFVVRFTAAGKVDADFNAGRAVILSNISEIRLDAITVSQNDGRIVAVGRARPARGTPPVGLIMVLNLSGSYNLVFNGGRPLFSNFISEGLYWLRCAIEENGSIIVAGNTGIGLVTETLSSVTARFRPDGVLDPTFNGTGFNRYDEPRLIEGTTDMVLHGGRVFVCGDLSVDAEPWPQVEGGFLLCYSA